MTCLSINNLVTKGFTKFGEDKSAIVPGKEDAKKPTSVEEFPRMVKEISGKIHEDAFVEDIGDMSDDQLSDDGSITKINENKPASVHGRDNDVEKTNSEGYPSQVKIGEDKSVAVPEEEDAKKTASDGESPRKVKEISSKMDRDTFGKEFDSGKMSVDQQPGLVKA